MSTLALIHGFLGTSEDWSEIRRRLQYSSVAIEIPSAAEWNAGIESVAAQLPEQSIVIGYSMGARIALGCALNHPQQIRALVLVSGNPGLAKEERDQRWKFDQQVCVDLMKLPPEQFVRQWYRQKVFSSLTDDQIESLVRDKRQLDSHRFAQLMTCYSIAKQPNYWDRLSELAVPVALVAGAKDQKYVDICREVQRRITNGRFYQVEGAGHIVHRECPDQFISLVNDLVTDLSKENVLR